MAEPIRLGRDFFDRDVVEVARALIGCVLWTARPDGATAGAIIETEAYAGADDPASHAARLKNGRVQSMAGPPGVAYIYRSYGIHTMLNLVCDHVGMASAVLIRALEPVAGIDVMRRRRGTEDDFRLCKGPGSLTIALGITLADHGVDVTISDWIWVEPGASSAAPVAGERIGISRGLEHPWRFFIPDSPYLSAHRRTVALSEPP